MDSTQDPADEGFLARLRKYLGQVPDALDDVAMEVVRDRLCTAPEEQVPDERGSSDSSR